MLRLIGFLLLINIVFLLFLLMLKPSERPKWASGLAVTFLPLLAVLVWHFFFRNKPDKPQAVKKWEKK